MGLRLTAVIFTYDCGPVGGLSHVFRGFPFTPLPADTVDREKLMSALAQGIVKPFEVANEIMELEMSFLWISLFIPILPHGLFFTMLAKQVECATDITKLLYVRRRPVPVQDTGLRREMNTFASCVAIASIGWTIGLSLITYNPDLWRLGDKGSLIVILMFAWIILSFLIAWFITMAWLAYITKKSRKDVCE